MAASNIIFGIVHIFTAILLIGLSIPLVKGEIPKNGLIGIRIKKAFESDENWYKINKYGGQQIIIWMIPLAIFGIASFFLPIDKVSLLYFLSLFAPLIVIAVPLIKTVMYARKL